MTENFSTFELQTNHHLTRQGQKILPGHQCWER